MTITPRAAKAKGHRLEKYIKDRLIYYFGFDYDDIRIPVGQENGADIKLSKRALNLFPYKIEAKSRNRIAVFRYYEQACGHSGKETPLLIIKEDRGPVLAVVELELFLQLAIAHGKTYE